MSAPLDAVLDHVAVAVPDWDAADARWRGQLGGQWVSWGDNAAFRARQYRFAGGGKLELVTVPAGGGGFVQRFLERHGAGVHHVTLKVPDFDEALARLGDAGLEVVDVGRYGDVWLEAFLRPTQVGGIVVQVAWSGQTDAQWAAHVGHVEPPLPADAATLLGPQLRHPDLDVAAALWALLGADVAPLAEGLVCRWPDSPLEVTIEQGGPAGPVGVRMAGTDPLPADATYGAAVLAATPAVP
jgi:catechol 2,3-dioxygenase-like lactoylglutathione lyase family enzyme